MKRIVKTKSDFQCLESFGFVAGISKMEPQFTMSIGEIVKRFTLPQVREMERLSLLNYDYGSDCQDVESSRLLELIDFDQPINDYTDLDRLARYASDQMARAKAEQALAAEAAKSEIRDFNKPTAEPPAPAPAPAVE